jgi:acetyl esterase/lipase
MVSLKFAAAALALASITLGAAAHASPWPPAPGHLQIPLWPGEAPDPMPVTGRTDSVLHPTITLYKPKAKNTGVAVVVYPGGGFWVLAMEGEGTEACDWLIVKGVTCVLVQYRVPGNDEKQSSRTGPYPKSPVALEDAQRAIALTRFHAKAWGVDPHKIGVLGFSAGGYLVAATSTLGRIYRPTDAIDQQSVRPDFGMALYPGHLWIDENKFELNPDVPVGPHTPPTFIVQNEDDPVDSVNNSLVYYIALKKAGVPTEMHLFAKGGHAFGLRHTDKPVTDWPLFATRWLKTIGMVGK